MVEAGVFFTVTYVYHELDLWDAAVTRFNTHNACCGLWDGLQPKGQEEAIGGSRVYLEEGHLRDYYAFFLERLIYFRGSV